MTRTDICIGVLLEDDALNVEELACACGADPHWVVERVEAGVLEAVSERGQWRFQSRQLQRARRLLATERTFDADTELAALVVDLIEEVERLRRELER